MKTTWLLFIGLLSCSGCNTGRSPGVTGCVVIVPDEEVHCPYHSVGMDRNNLLYVDLRDGTVRAASVERIDEAEGRIVLDPFLETGWQPGVATVSPDGEKILVARRKEGCNDLACSQGRLTLWLARHRANDPNDPDDDIWQHVNLTRRGLGRNSEVHGWTTWLHEDLALFNALVRDDDAGWITGQGDNAAQVYALRFRDGVPDVAPYGPAQLWRGQCLTGRVNAQPARGGCFRGQRVSLVRRCYDEPRSARAWAWFNTRAADGSGGHCIAGPAFEVPVLRTYVLELDESCVPTKPFEQLVAVRTPPDAAANRQMGVTPEWGDMLSAISPDGRYLAVAANLGDPTAPAWDNCAGFRVNLTNPADPMSGNATRRTTVCELDADLRCRDGALLLGAEHMPPEGTPLPTFIALANGEPVVAHTREWSASDGSAQRDIVRVDFLRGADARVPLVFARNALGGQAIYGR